MRSLPSRVNLRRQLSRLMARSDWSLTSVKSSACSLVGGHLAIRWLQSNAIALVSQPIIAGQCVQSVDKLLNSGITRINFVLRSVAAFMIKMHGLAERVGRSL